MKVCSSRRAGLTLIELVVALVLVGLITAKAAFVVEQSLEFSRSSRSSIVLEEAAEGVLDRIALSLMGADRESLMPLLDSPLDSSEIAFRVSLGMEDGEVVWGGAEHISLEDQRAVTWRQEDDVLGDRRAVWTNLARPFLEGELPNGLDDNGNGLIDESGLSFTIDDRTVVVRLSLADGRGDAVRLTRTVEATVTCRNFLDRRNGIAGETP